MAAPPSFPILQQPPLFHIGSISQYKTEFHHINHYTRRTTEYLQRYGCIIQVTMIYLSSRYHPNTRLSLRQLFSFQLWGSCLWSAQPFVNFVLGSTNCTGFFPSYLRADIMPPLTPPPLTLKQNPLRKSVRGPYGPQNILSYEDKMTPPPHFSLGH